MKRFTILAPAWAVCICSAGVSASVLKLPIWFKNTCAVVQASIGTPAQEQFLLFDTGSSTTWMVDQFCAEYCDNYSGYQRKGYNSSASVTASSLGTYASIDYLGGVTAGYGMTDVFSLAGCKPTWNQTAMAADTSSWSFIPADGFLGLAYSTIADAGTTTVVETLIQKQLIDQPRFSIYFGKEFTDTGNSSGTGSLTIGASEEDKYVDGGLTWLPVLLENAEYELWRTSISSMTGTLVGKNGRPRSVTTPFSGAWAVFDTGAGDIMVPSSQIDAVYESIGMNFSAILHGQQLPRCADFNSSWSVSFALGDAQHPRSVTLTGDQLARPGFAGSDEYCWPPFDQGDTEGFVLIGTPFLHQVYSVFDFGAFDVPHYQPRIGVGQLKKQWKPTSKAQ